MQYDRSLINRRRFNVALGAVLAGPAGSVLAQNKAAAAKPLAGQTVKIMWIDPLSGLMARIDEALNDKRGTSRTTVEGLLREVHGLLRSGRQGAFETRYRDALQESPEVVIAHADVVRALPPRLNGP